MNSLPSSIQIFMTLDIEPMGFNLNWMVPVELVSYLFFQS